MLHKIGVLVLVRYSTFLNKQTSKIKIRLDADDGFNHMLAEDWLNVPRFKPISFRLHTIFIKLIYYDAHEAASSSFHAKNIEEMYFWWKRTD